MRELRFSICNLPPDILEVLKPFNKNRPANVQVKLHVVPWDNYKQELTAMALYGQGADVSQVGGPLVNDLVAMKALRPFTSRDIDSLGGADAFSPVAWDNSRRTSEGHVFAIPWILDPRAIIYWRDMLEKADIDESKAFTSYEQMEETFRKLQGSGLKTPWVFWMEKYAALQVAYGWIWGTGGEIGNEKEVSILEPKALLGLRNYFGMYRYMNKTELQLDTLAAFTEVFTNQRAAVTTGNLSLYRYLKQCADPKIREQLAVAIAPGPLFLGSSSLVIWQSTRDEADAMSLVRYMLDEGAQKDYCVRAGFLPARSSVPDQEPFSTDPILQVFARAALDGRTIANLKLSGLLEDLLSTAISRVWEKILSDPRLNVEATIRQEMEPIIRRANLWNNN